MATKTKTPKTSKPLPPTTPPAKGAAWWEDYLAERDARWGGVTGRMWDAGGGAKGLGAYTVWKWRQDGDETWAYTEALRFAKGFAQIVAGPAFKAIGWVARDDEVPYANLTQGRIALGPTPIARTLNANDKEKLDRDLAHTIVGGVAIHEAAHLRGTPHDWLTAFERLNDDHRTQLGNAARAMVEDAFVETLALATYPGYTSYLAACWDDVRPEATVVDHVYKASNDDDTTLAHLLEVVQDRSRRYSPTGDHYEQALAALPDDKRRFVAAGERILRRAHDHAADHPRRLALAAELYTLFATGRPAAEDRPDLGEETFTPSGEQVERANQAARRMVEVEGFLDGNYRGQDIDDDDRLERAIAADVADAIERDLRREDVEIVTPDGTRTAKTEWIDLAPDARQAAEARERVRALTSPLARRLAFRAERPEQLVGGQVRGRLDDRRLAEIPGALHAGAPVRAFARREQISAPHIALPVLVDLSGSMSNNRRYWHARNAAMLIHEALGRLKRESGGGVDYTITGHSTADGGDGEICRLYRIVDDRHPQGDRIGAIGAMANNLDGPAIAAVAAMAERRWPDRRRILLYLNDGQPAGDAYGGPSAHREIAGHRAHLKARGTDLLTIFLGEDAPARVLTTMYGAEDTGWLRVADVAQLPQVLAATLRRLLKWQA